MSKLGKDLISALKEAQKKGLIQLPTSQSINGSRNRPGSTKVFSSKQSTKFNAQGK